MDRHGGAVTLTDVARAAGVSLATASRALNGSTRRVREDLRERVLRTAAELDYSVNAPAQAMARGRTNVVGLLVHDIADPYFSQIATGVMRAAEEHDLVVTIVNTLRRPEKELEYVATLRGQRVRAIILTGSRLEGPGSQERLEHELTAFEAAGGRVALVSQRRLPFDTVQLENRAGARALAEQLVELGHRQFLALAGPREVLTSRDRLQGFRDGLARHGITLPAERIRHTEFTRDGGYRAMADALDAGFTGGCVFAVNDVMAVGAMAACRERGVRLPEEIAVAGYDDIASLRDITPRLTTVWMPLEDLGVSALELVLDAPQHPPRIRRVKGQVVVRESTPDLR